MVVARTRNPIVNYEDAEGHFIPKTSAKISLLKLLAFEFDDRSGISCPSWTGERDSVTGDK